MATAREMFDARMLASKYGPVGRVAAGYRTAGFQVKVLDKTGEEPVSFIAWKKGARFAVRVVIKSESVSANTVKALIEEAKKNDARPVLVLYGRGPKIEKDALEEAKSQGVKVRRFRA